MVQKTMTPERPITLPLDKARDLEKQIQSQILTTDESIAYFKSENFANNFTKFRYATTSQIKELSHKGRNAVRGLNPWEGDGIDFWKTTPTEKLKIPEPKTCEFCGAPREYLGLICKSDSFYDWEIKKWSIIPQHCCCDKAQQQHIIEEKERQKKEAEARQRMAEEAKKEKFKKLMFESGIKPRFLTRTFENFLIDTPGRKTAGHGYDTSYFEAGTDSEAG